MRERERRSDGVLQRQRDRMKKERAGMISGLCQQTQEWKLSACIISLSLLIHVCWVQCSFNISDNASTYVMAHGGLLK